MGFMKRWFASFPRWKVGAEIEPVEHIGRTFKTVEENDEEVRKEKEDSDRSTEYWQRKYQESNNG